MIPYGLLSGIGKTKMGEDRFLDEVTEMAKRLKARSLFWLPASQNDSEVIVIVPLGKGEMRLKLRRPLLIVAFGASGIAQRA